MNPILDIMLTTAVPMYIHQLRGWSTQRRAETADRCTDLTTLADVVLEPTRKEAGTTAATFNAVAKGLACLAYAPGGITFGGIHWCSTLHPGGTDKVGLYECPGSAPEEPYDPSSSGRIIETITALHGLL